MLWISMILMVGAGIAMVVEGVRSLRAHANPPKPSKKKKKKKQIATPAAAWTMIVFGPIIAIACPFLIIWFLYK